MEKQNFIKNLQKKELQKKGTIMDEGEELDKVVMNKLMENAMDNGEEFEYDSEEDPCPVVNFDNELHFIRELKAVDIVFLVDCTASMNAVFRGVKKFIRKLVWDAAKCLTQYLLDEPEPIQVGLVKYRDHPPQNKTFVTEIFQLTSDFKSFKSTVMKMTAAGGGDDPEAVIDGLDAAVNKMNWRSESFKFIYHLLDAPPHGKDFNDANNDAFSGGCPCNIDYEEILREMRSLDIHYNIIKLSKNIDKMINVFSSILDLEVTIPNIEADNSKKIVQTD